MFLIRPYQTHFGPSKVHHRSARFPLETSNMTTCDLDLPGHKYVGAFSEITCKNCQRILTGVRTSPGMPAEQLSLLDG